MCLSNFYEIILRRISDKKGLTTQLKNNFYF